MGVSLLSPLCPVVGDDVVSALRAGRSAEFVPFLQTKVCLQSFRIAGYEALLRWQPGNQIFSPDRLLPAIAAAGALPELFAMMLTQACQCLARLQTTTAMPPAIAVNLHPQALADPDLVARVRATVARHGVPSRLIEFEILETEEIADLDQAAAAIQALRQAGFQVSLDDFGARYASLLCLANLPVSGVKIDSAFLAAEQGEAVIASVISLCHRLGMSVTVEGLETAAHVELAQRAGADIGQGYFFVAPRAAAEICGRQPVAGLRGRSAMPVASAMD